MKQYLLSVHYVDGQPATPVAEMEVAYARVEKVNQELRSAGAWVFGGGLLTPDVATVVRVEDGRTSMTDGPFAEAKEQIGGFWVLRCTDLDQALAWAEKCAEACGGPVEVRPFQDEPDN